MASVDEINVILSELREGIVQASKTGNLAELEPYFSQQITEISTLIDTIDSFLAEKTILSAQLELLKNMLSSLHASIDTNNATALMDICYDTIPMDLSDNATPMGLSENMLGKRKSPFSSEDGSQDNDPGEFYYEDPGHSNSVQLKRRRIAKQSKPVEPVEQTYRNFEELVVGHSRSTITAKILASKPMDGIKSTPTEISFTVAIDNVQIYARFKEMLENFSADDIIKDINIPPAFAKPMFVCVSFSGPDFQLTAEKFEEYLSSDLFMITSRSDSDSDTSRTQEQRKKGKYKRKRSIQTDSVQTTSVPKGPVVNSVDIFNIHIAGEDVPLEEKQTAASDQPVGVKVLNVLHENLPATTDTTRSVDTPGIITRREEPRTEILYKNVQKFSMRQREREDSARAPDMAIFGFKQQTAPSQPGIVVECLISRPDYLYHHVGDTIEFSIEIYTYAAALNIIEEIPDLLKYEHKESYVINIPTPLPEQDNIVICFVFSGAWFSQKFDAFLQRLKKKFPNFKETAEFMALEYGSAERQYKPTFFKETSLPFTTAPCTTIETHYEILGVARTASEEEIKEAYHRLAMQWHPDKNRDNPDAQEKFITISAAYTTLSNKPDRKKYDATLEKSSPTKNYGAHNPWNYDEEPSCFKDLLGTGEEGTSFKGLLSDNILSAVSQLRFNADGSHRLVLEDSKNVSQKPSREPPQKKRAPIKPSTEIESYISENSKSFKERLESIHVEKTAIPLEFLCGLTHEVMNDPVALGNGSTFEKEALVRYFTISNSHPSTGTELRADEKTFIECPQLKEKIRVFVETKESDAVRELFGGENGLFRCTM